MKNILKDLERLKKETQNDPILSDLIDRAIDHIIWKEFDSKSNENR